MARTEAVVEDKMLVRDLRRYVMAQIPIRRKENMLVRQFPDDLDGIRRRDADIGHSLDSSRRIDIADDGQVVILSPDLFNRLYVSHMSHRAAGRRIGHEDLLFRVEHLGTFPHKVDTGKDDDLGIRFNRLLGQAKRITDKICIFLNFIRYIIVSKDNSLLLFFQSSNLIFDIHQTPSFQGRGCPIKTPSCDNLFYLKYITAHHPLWDRPFFCLPYYTVSVKI